MMPKSVIVVLSPRNCAIREKKQQGSKVPTNVVLSDPFDGVPVPELFESRRSAGRPKKRVDAPSPTTPTHVSLACLTLTENKGRRCCMCRNPDTQKTDKGGRKTYFECPVTGVAVCPPQTGRACHQEFHKLPLPQKEAKRVKREPPQSE